MNGLRIFIELAMILLSAVGAACLFGFLYMGIAFGLFGFGAVMINFMWKKKQTQNSTEESAFTGSISIGNMLKAKIKRTAKRDFSLRSQMGGMAKADRQEKNHGDETR